MAVNLEERVDRLETLFGQFVSQIGSALLRLERNTEAFQKEMREFKDEMRVFKDEMDAFKKEMQDFKDEMRVFRDETRAENRKMNQKWGELARRLGTIAEDLVYPSLERIIMEQFNLEVDELISNKKQRHPQTGERREFDCIAAAGELVFLNSTKSKLKKQDVDDFEKEDIPAFREYFPQYRDYKLVGILAALRIDAGALKYAEKRGFLVLGVGDEVMEVKNTPGFKPRLW